MSNKQVVLDAYAPPYVPLKLKQLNQAAALVVPSTPAPCTQYASYTASFAGHSFLASRDFPPGTTVEDPSSNGAEAASLVSSTYKSTFATALRQEETALRQEYEAHAIYQTSLTQTPSDAAHSMYRLIVPGLREFNLPLEVGDIVRLKQLRFDARGELIVFSGFTAPDRAPVPGSLDVCHEAVVWVIDRMNETLFLRLDGLRPMSMLFNASFTIQSSRADALHRAVNEAHAHLQESHSWLRAMLFPTRDDGAMQHKLNPSAFNFELFDDELNHEQLRAVHTILKEKYGRLPYLISGPPGTGKTKTIVEIALQLIHEHNTSRVLLCAPSDPAADTTVHRLSKHLTPNELLRMNSSARSFPEVPASIMPFCHVEDKFFSLPPFADLMRRRIVVTTVRDAEVLHQARLTNRDLFALERDFHTALHPEDTSYVPSLHWTALLIDEAAQAAEPEALLSLLAVAPPKNVPKGLKEPRVVMVGDQNQLGPRTASKKPVIQKSLFERLLLRPIYCEHPLTRSKQNGGHVPRLTRDMLPIMKPPFTDLIRNYRSHPAILATPSSLFYNDTLEPCASGVESLLTWKGFKGRKLPVLFRDNRSEDEIEQDGGGWFNVGEANIALEMAQSFLRQELLQPEQICIMSPFRAQVKVLRKKARAQAKSGINIGPLEAFQGLESRLVILCTTRTRDRFINQDMARGLGVIHEPRRFNVALTRAKQGLIVIGNPDVLDLDENWASFLAFCKRTGSWEGELGWRAPHSEKVKRSRLEKQMHLRNMVEEAGDERINGTRQLGISSREEDGVWNSGVAAEEAVRDAEASPN
ncbi:hypothetical protein AC579_32 [Pseudocercospora musae]|uniref:Uncharacterized protein n=1 Tax=Pseudocercospora musae TaxID=113226 RepID=A0A139IGV0_9PEZI|nr:hypothetical protein AC579_32 [Pseudocercospora musae]